MPKQLSELLLPDSGGVLLVSADFVVLGKVVGPYGLRGAVRVYPFADDPMAWARLPCWWIGKEGVSPDLWQQSRVVKCKAHGDVLVAELECLPDRDASEAAQGMLVGVPRSGMPPVAENEYYWADLVGLDVFNTGEQPLGRVLGLIETSANDVLRIGDGEGQERLLPFVATVVLDVDLSARRVRVDWEVDW